MSTKKMKTKAQIQDALFAATAAAITTAQHGDIKESVSSLLAAGVLAWVLNDDAHPMKRHVDKVLGGLGAWVDQNLARQRDSGEGSGI